jgi:hypothetical protein
MFSNFCSLENAINESALAVSYIHHDSIDRYRLQSVTVLAATADPFTQRMLTDPRKTFLPAPFTVCAGAISAILWMLQTLQIGINALQRQAVARQPAHVQAH